MQILPRTSLAHSSFFSFRILTSQPGVILVMLPGKVGKIGP
jgi:hypothetical protein